MKVRLDNNSRFLVCSQFFSWNFILHLIYNKKPRSFNFDWNHQFLHSFPAPCRAQIVYLISKGRCSAMVYQFENLRQGHQVSTWPNYQICLKNSPDTIWDCSIRTWFSRIWSNSIKVTGGLFTYLMLFPKFRNFGKFWKFKN